MVRLPLSLLLVTLLAACGAAQVPIAFEPVEIKHRTTPSGQRVYVKDFNLLYEEGLAHEKAGRDRDAAELLEILIDEFPNHQSLAALYYHAGLARMRLRDHDKASAHFRESIRRYAGTRDARDGLFLLAEALQASGKLLEAADVYLGALSDPQVHKAIGGPLGVLDQLEAMTQRGIVLRKAGEAHKADRQLREVETLYRDHRDIRPVAESDWVARAYFERGEIYRELFDSIHFKLPVERMKRELEDKANLFLKAQNAYFRAVRLHNERWSLAAGYQIGALYARLIDDIYAAEVPGDLDEVTIEAYREELWKHTSVLARKAVVVFRKNIDLARRMGRDDEWVTRSQRQLERMETLIRTEKERERSQQPIERANYKEGMDPARRKRPGG